MPKRAQEYQPWDEMLAAATYLKTGLWLTAEQMNCIEAADVLGSGANPAAIARMTGYPEATVRTILAGLEKDGHIEIIRSRAHVGGGAASGCAENVRRAPRRRP